MFYARMSVWTCAQVCTDACMYVGMYVGMYACPYVCLQVGWCYSWQVGSMRAGMHVSTPERVRRTCLGIYRRVCRYVCTVDVHAYMYACTYAGMRTCVHVYIACMYVGMHAYMHVCMSVVLENAFAIYCCTIQCTSECVRSEDFGIKCAGHILIVREMLVLTI